MIIFINSMHMFLERGRLIVILTFIIINLVFKSCVPSRPLTYFAPNIDTAITLTHTKAQVRYQIGDRIPLKINSDNIEATRIYNQAGVANTSDNNNQRGTIDNTPIYLVNSDSSILLHGLGKVFVVGLTKSELEELINRKLESLGVLKNPYCTLGSLQYKLTMLGEFKNPGVYFVSTDCINLYEAIGMAGDMTEFAQKNKVLIMRNIEGKQSFVNINLSDRSIFTSENFFLRNNDIVVVNPIRNKPTMIDQKNIQIASVTIALLTTVGVMVNLLR